MEDENEYLSDGALETNEDTLKRDKMPVIEPLEEEDEEEIEIPQVPKKRTKRKYTITAKVIERNKRVAAARVAKEKENKKKLEEYEYLKSVKYALSAKEAEDLFNSKLTQLETKLEKLAKETPPPPSTPKQAEVPKLIPIAEDPREQYYSSDNSEKRRSARFQPKDISPQVSSFRERFRR